MNTDESNPLREALRNLDACPATVERAGNALAQSTAPEHLLSEADYADILHKLYSGHTHESTLVDMATSTGLQEYRAIESAILAKLRASPTSPVTVEPASKYDLMPVITWLERGGDVADAVKELRLIHPQIAVLVHDLDHFVNVDEMVATTRKGKTPRTTLAIRRSAKSDRPGAVMAECSKAIERDLTEAIEAILAMSLANKSAAPLSQWQQTTTKKADELLARIGA